MKRKIIFILMIFNISSGVAAQEPENLKAYTFVMLTKGQDRSQSGEELIRIQEAHLRYLDGLTEDGILNIAGPFTGDKHWRGILIFDSTDIELVRSCVDGDPAVKAGRLSYEIHPWMSQRGANLK